MTQLNHTHTPNHAGDAADSGRKPKRAKKRPTVVGMMMTCANRLGASKMREWTIATKTVRDPTAEWDQCRAELDRFIASGIRCLYDCWLLPKQVHAYHTLH